MSTDVEPRHARGARACADTQLGTLHCLLDSGMVDCQLAADTCTFGNAGFVVVSGGRCAVWRERSHAAGANVGAPAGADAFGELLVAARVCRSALAAFDGRDDRSCTCAGGGARRHGGSS